MKKIFLVATTIFSFLLLNSVSLAGSFDFSPSTGNFIRQCPDRVAINIDTEGIISNSADIKINFDPSQVDIIDSLPNLPGTQIMPGTAYETYVGNVVNEVDGYIRLSGVSFVQNLQGQGVFAYVEFESKGTTNNSVFEIEFTSVGNTLDSNIAEAVSSDDYLTSVTDGSFSYIDGECTPDIYPPQVTFNTPQNGQTGIPVNADLVFTITDTDSDIDLDTLVVVIAGRTYTINDPELSCTGGGNTYTCTLLNNPDLPTGEIIVTVSVYDLAGNRGAGSITFNRPAVVVGPTSPPTPPAPKCGETCDENTPCAAGLSCENNSCKLIDCIGRSCTCNVTFQQCGGECIDNNDCEANLSCSAGLCKIPSCVDNETCACTPPALICEEVPQTTNIINQVTDTVSELYEELIPAPIRDIVDDVSVPGIATGILTLGLLINLLSFLSAIRYPQLFFLWLGMFFGKDNKPWGIIYDDSNNKPIPYASVRVYLKGTKTLLEQKISDGDGRYGLVLNAGKYRLEVDHADYIKQEIEIEVEKDNDNVPNDIALVPKEITEEEKGSIFDGIFFMFRSINRFFNEHIGFMIGFGFAMSLLAVILSPILYNYITLTLYGISFVFYIISRIRVNKKWGEVVDTSTGLRIPFAIVKMFNRNTWELVDTQMTNQNGSFGMFSDPGEYAILVSVRGYKFPSAKQIGLEVNKEKFGVLDLNIKENKSIKVTLMVDPLKTGEKQSKVEDLSNTNQDLGNLQSPFS